MSNNTRYTSFRMKLVRRKCIVHAVETLPRYRVRTITSVEICYTKHNVSVYYSPDDLVTNGSFPLTVVSVPLVTYYDITQILNILFDKKKIPPTY